MASSKKTASSGSRKDAAAGAKPGAAKPAAKKPSAKKPARASARPGASAPRKPAKAAAAGPAQAAKPARSRVSAPVAVTRSTASAPTSPIPVAKAEAPAPKPRKPKLVRDSFTIPKDEYAALDVLKARGARLGRAAKKSEVLRAGLKALSAMADTTFLAALREVPAIKTGRPAGK